jgi:hypothetical protein
MAQVEEPGERGGAAGTRRGVVLALARPSSCCSLRSSIEKQDVGDQGDAENDRRDPGYFDAENPAWVKCHAPSLEAVERRR